MNALSTVTAILICIKVALSDIYARRVPNRWLLLALAVGALLHAHAWLAGQAGFPVAALLGLGIGLVALLPFYAIGWMGAGDVKFFAVLGFLLGWRALLPIWIGASLLAGVHALLALSGPHLVAQLATVTPLRLQFCLQNGRTRLSRNGGWQRMQAARQGRHGIPYAAYLAIATLALLLWPQLWPGALP